MLMNYSNLNLRDKDTIKLSGGIIPTWVKFEIDDYSYFDASKREVKEKIVLALLYSDVIWSGNCVKYLRTLLRLDKEKFSRLFGAGPNFVDKLENRGNASIVTTKKIESLLRSHLMSYGLQAGFLRETNLGDKVSEMQELIKKSKPENNIVLFLNFKTN
jgi:hypothetical protein